MALAIMTQEGVERVPGMGDWGLGIEEGIGLGIGDAGGL